MAVTSRFTLAELIELGPACRRYRGKLRSGADAEICLLNTSGDSASRTIDPADSAIATPFWLQRFRCARLLADPNCLPLLTLDEDHQPPFVAFPAIDTPPLSALVADRTLLETQFNNIALAALQALAACENVGLVVGGITLQSMFRRAGHWQVDVSGLRSIFLPTDQPAPHTHWLPPELSSARERRTELQDWDFAADIYAFAKLLRFLAEKCWPHQPSAYPRVIQLSEDCLAPDPLARPSAKELLERLRNDRPNSHRSFDVTSDSDALSERNDPDGDLELTINVDGGMEVPAGVLVEGSQLGRYTINERLGLGGMGAVYRALDAVDGKSVAIKILNRQVASDSVTARRFAKEARILAKANNPYVANLYEVNSDAAMPYLVVEYVEGGTLGSVIEPGKPLNEHFVLAVMIDAVRGLAIAHTRGIVHRDFKPDNVLLTSAARTWIAEHSPYGIDASDTTRLAIGPIYAKVSDFGLARTSQQSESMAVTRDGTLLGTPMYMSPEQCRGEAAGPAADVYSVGVTLFQMLAGRAPFEADSQVALLNQHCNTPPPSLKQLRPELPDALVRTTENCLAKNPQSRYANAGELLIDLENILRGKPTSLGLHPPVLSTNDPNVLRFEHRWDLDSSPSALWPFVSNTDRVNHAIGLPAVNYTVRQDPVYGTQRFAEAKIAGQRIRWQEHPYEWIEGRRLSVLREFTHGPFHWFVNVVELQPSAGGGTQLVQSLIVSPRNWLGKQLARIQLGNKSKANFGRAYRQIDTYLTQSEQSQADRDPFVGRTELRPGQQQKLQARIEQLRSRRLDPQVIDTLAQFLQHASDLEVARIRPIALAQRFQLSSEQVIDACLEGTRLGIFDLLWDILCPSCRIPSSIQETLQAITDHSYCEACNVSFGIDLAESVELIFRMHPEIRPVQTATYCIGGPAWSRHVVAQVRLAAGERFVCELNLTEGSYILRGPQLPFTVDLRVGHAHVLKRVELSLARPPMHGQVQLPVGAQVICLCNDSASDQQVRIERTAARHDALSAAKASTIALFRELFPGEVLSSDQMVSIAHITLMRIKFHQTQQLYESLGDGPAFSRIRKELQHFIDCVKVNSGTVVKTIGEGVLASFHEVAPAVRAATQLIQHATEQNLSISIAVHQGAAMVATIDQRLDYFGRTLQTLEALVDAAEPLSIALSPEVTDTAEVQSLIRELQWDIEVAPAVQTESNQIVHQVRCPSSRKDMVS